MNTREKTLQFLWSSHYFRDGKIDIEEDADILIKTWPVDREYIYDDQKDLTMLIPSDNRDWGENMAAKYKIKQVLLAVNDNGDDDSSE